MYIGRYYLIKKNGFQQLIDLELYVDDYDTTIYVEEALHRLVEIYYTIGLKMRQKIC